MAIPRNKWKTRMKDLTIDKELDGSFSPARRLPPGLPPDKYDPRSHVQAARQRHPPRAPGP